MSEFELALPFATDNHQFVMGVEIGRLWERFKNPEPFEQTIHAENAEMVLRIMEVTGREAHTDASDDPMWLHLVVEDLEATP